MSSTSLPKTSCPLPLSLLSSPRTKSSALTLASAPPILAQLNLVPKLSTASAPASVSLPS